MWGATDKIASDVKEFEISIHAPMWGATVSASLNGNYSYHFNPRTHVGCDKNAVTE